MERVYAELSAGATPTAALRAGKLSLIRSAGNYRKPYYWGGFQTYAGHPPASQKAAARSRVRMRSSGMPVSAARSETLAP
jgi:hypothetical protein